MEEMLQLVDAFTLMVAEPPVWGIPTYDCDNRTSLRNVGSSLSDHQTTTEIIKYLIHNLQFSMFRFLLIKDIFDTNRGIPALAKRMVALPHIRITIDALWSREGCVAINIHTLILQDL